MKFYSSVRVDVRRMGAIKDGENVIGNRTKIKVAKNKVAPPFREAEFDILYGEGVSRELDVLDTGVSQGIIEKSGSWYSFNGERMGQGRDNSRTFLKEHPEICNQIEARLRANFGLALADLGNALENESRKTPNLQDRLPLLTRTHSA